MYSKMADSPKNGRFFKKMANFAESARGIGHFKIPSVTLTRGYVVVCTSFSLEEQSLHSIKNGIKVFLFKLSKMKLLQEKAFNEILLWRNVLRD